MTINSINSRVDGNAYANSNLPGERATALPGNVDQNNQIDNFELSPASGRLDALLEEISDRGANALDALKERAGTLQENFLDRLYARLDEGGIDLTEKLTLRLSNEGRLVTAGEHPQKVGVDAMLAGSSDLADTFMDIASHSELIRDIGNIRKTVFARSQVQQYEDTAQNNPMSVYQLSLKGGMSHFFFSRP